VTVEHSEEPAGRTLASLGFRRPAFIDNASAQRFLDAFDQVRRSRRQSWVGAASHFGKTHLIREIRRRYPVHQVPGRTYAPVVRTGIVEEGSTSRSELDKSIVSDIGSDALAGRRSPGTFGQAVHLLAACGTEVIIVDEAMSYSRLQRLHVKRLVEAAQNSPTREAANHPHPRAIGVMFVTTLVDSHSMPTEATGLRAYEVEQFAGRLDPEMDLVGIAGLSIDELRPVVKTLERLHRQQFPTLLLAKWTPKIHAALLADEFHPLYASVPMGNALDLVEKIMGYLWLGEIEDIYSEKFGDALLKLATEELAMLRIRQYQLQQIASQAHRKRGHAPPAFDIPAFGGTAASEAAKRERVLHLLDRADLKRRRIARAS
jgi:hypothetical protein